MMLGAGTGCDGRAEGEQVHIIQRWRERKRARQELRRATPEAQTLAAYFRARDAA